MIEILVRPDGQQMLVCALPVQAGVVLGELPRGPLTATADRYSIQVSETEHLPVEPPLKFLNHSCDPNTFVDTGAWCLRALRPIAAGEELSFFYPSTEWLMAEPFECWCGAERCLRRIDGARELPDAAFEGRPVAPHIEALLRSQRTPRAA